jgi:hypothetical protein
MPTNNMHRHMPPAVLTCALDVLSVPACVAATALVRVPGCVVVVGQARVHSLGTLRVGTRLPRRHHREHRAVGEHRRGPARQHCEYRNAYFKFLGKHTWFATHRHINGRIHGHQLMLIFVMDTSSKQWPFETSAAVVVSHCYHASPQYPVGK